MVTGYPSGQDLLVELCNLHLKLVGKATAQQMYIIERWCLTHMRKELVGVDDDSILDTAQQINEVINVRGGYCASKNITDFSWFPELNIPWNAYILESVSEKQSFIAWILWASAFQPVPLAIA